MTKKTSFEDIAKNAKRTLKLNVFRVNHRTKLVKIKFNFEGV